MSSAQVKQLDPKALRAAREAYWEHGGNALSLTSPDRLNAAIRAYLSALEPGEPAQPVAWRYRHKGMSPEEIRLDNLKMIAIYSGPIVSFECRDPYYLASCDHCGWVGSSELCGTDSFGDDSDVCCPRCHSSGADCGKVAAALSGAPAGWRLVAKADTKKTFSLEWIAAPRPPVHPTPMAGQASFPSFDDAVAFMRRQSADSTFVSLTEHITITEKVDRTVDARAALPASPAAQGDGQ